MPGRASELRNALCTVSISTPERRELLFLRSLYNMQSIWQLREVVVKLVMALDGDGGGEDVAVLVGSKPGTIPFAHNKQAVLVTKRGKILRHILVDLHTERCLKRAYRVAYVIYYQADLTGRYDVAGCKCCSCCSVVEIVACDEFDNITCWIVEVHGMRIP